MFWNIIDDNRKEVLQNVVENVLTGKYYYMAGGTALSLQTGFRESFDFDFFVKEKFDTNILLETLSGLGEIKATFISEDTLHCILNNVKLTFLYFPNDLINDLIKVEGFKNLYLASIIDISVMKLLAISQRGTKKDFFDLYNICISENTNLTNVFDLLSSKYSEEKLNYLHIIKSIVYFEDAEDELLPKTFVEYDWEKVKAFYESEYKKLINEI